MQVPQDFILQMQDILKDETPDFLSTLDEKSPVSVRLNNKLKLNPDYLKVEHCRNAFYLPQRPQFTLDPWLHAGVYYVQEASSMYLEKIVEKYVKSDVNILDLCAAPGGKSTHLSSLISPDSLLVSNEIMPQRAFVLAENMIKWGDANTIVCNNKPKDFSFADSFFDVILADVPCSGEGMFRKEPKAIEDWSLNNVAMCAQRQKQIISDVWNTLKENGLLIYSTCTFNTQEDEDNVRWIESELGAECMESEHFYFHKNRGEGFFIAALRKISNNNNTCRIKVQKTEKAHALLSNLTNADDLTIIRRTDSVDAVPHNKLSECKFLSEKLNILKCGTKLCTQKGKDEIPDIQLALSKHIDTSKVNKLDLDWSTSIKYLKKEALRLDNAPIGYVLLSFRSVPLGWVKNIGNRCNNLYPNEWRIRMNNIPNEQCELPF